MLIDVVDRDIEDVPLYVPKWAVKVLQTLLPRIIGPNLDSVVVHSDELVRILVEVGDVCALLVLLIACLLEDLALAFVHIPDNNLAI